MTFEHARGSRTQRRVLLVEDEPTNMMILSKYLRDSGLFIEKASDGDAAWDLLTQSNQNFDFAIVDRRMPGMDGIELSKRIRSHPKLRSMPIIMQTSANTLVEVAEGVKAGANYYLIKPYDKAAILKLVNQVIRDREKSRRLEERLSLMKQDLDGISEAKFSIRTPEQAEHLSHTLGSLFPRAELAVAGLHELLRNAIEHGNLKIGGTDRQKLAESGMLESEIATRLDQPFNKFKLVKVTLNCSEKEIRVHIADEGDGFDWKSHLQPAAGSMKTSGIEKASFLCFDRLEYSEKGNEVTVSCDL